MLWSSVLYAASLLATVQAGGHAPTNEYGSGSGYSNPPNYGSGSGSGSGSGCPTPPPPAPEPVELSTLPMPPVTANVSTGGCTTDINPHGTGCTGAVTYLQVGSFLPDGNHILAQVRFAGAPAAPDPASIYNGQQVIVIKADGTLFANGDAWKCITCGVDPSRAVGATGLTVDYAYPVAFKDGRRIQAGVFVIDGGADLTSEDSTPETTWIYTIRMESNADGSGTGQYLRELRLHPDNVHIGLNALGLTAARSLSQWTYFGRLQFNPAPTTGQPLAPRYDVVNVNRLIAQDGGAPLYAEGDELFFNHSAITVGELRGFTGSGKEVTYIGYPTESCNIDVYAADLETGAVRRLTEHPGYTDPVEFAPDDSSFVVMDTRGTGRTEFMDGLRWLPPVADQITATACASVRNNRNRRFFQPWLLDRYGDRGDYYGQSLTQADKGTPGSGDYDDPEWNARADPYFSPDGTRVVFWQALTVSPECGGANPLPCYPSKEPGGRTERIIVARLTSRQPKPRPAVDERPDVIPWATPYIAGSTNPQMAYPREGQYTLRGQKSGYANVTIVENAARTGILRTVVELYDYSDDGAGRISGSQNITVTVEGITLNYLDWYSDLTRTGAQAARQYTSPDGLHMSIDAMQNIFDANGTLVTETEGVVFRQPLNGA